jgi:beta-glucosidase
MGPVLEAFEMGVEEFGEEYMRARFETSAVRLLRNIFYTGLFENTYLDPENAAETVGHPDFMQEGYEAQLKSVVMLKNREQTLPAQENLKVYMPERYLPERRNWFGSIVPERWENLMSTEIASDIYTVVDSPEEADFAIVSIKSPMGGNGYLRSDAELGGNGYLPISLQYGNYIAENAREVSIAGGSTFEDFTNRSYRGKQGSAANVYDMELVNSTKEEMGEKPVIVTIKVGKPMVFEEFEDNADAILIHSGVQDQALLEIISGMHEPSGLLPFQMPESMETVENQYEDTSRDMDPHQDSEDNIYDFAFGLNWNSVINDDRVQQYR